jgi:hypothetical protein
MIAAAILYIVARFEVSRSLLKRRTGQTTQCDDWLSPLCVPSAAQGDKSDRDLAEIDQDGFAFALDKRDTAFFNTRTRIVTRRHHRLQIVLRDGVICMRKRSVPVRRDRFLERIRDFVKWDFYLEAAALLRLEELEFVPKLRRIDCSNGAIEMDYIPGKDLRHVLAEGRHEIDYDKVSQDFLAVIKSEDPTSQEIRRAILGVMRCGVIPRDITAAGFIRAEHSRRLYMIDFNLSYLRPVPGWRKHAENLDWLLG